MVRRLAVVKWPQVVFMLTWLFVVLGERTALPDLASTQVIARSLGGIHGIIVSEGRVWVLLHQVLSLPLS